MKDLVRLPWRYHLGLLAAVVGLGLCAAFGVTGSRGWWDLQEIRAEQALLEERAFAFERKNQDIRDHIERLRSDDPYLEKLARERLGWVKDGEILYRTENRSDDRPVHSSSINASSS